MNDADLRQLVESLALQVRRLTADVRQLQDPRRAIFLADQSSPGSDRAMQELIPDAGGTALANLENGRTVTGTTDPGVFLAIPGLKAGQAVMMGFANGTNTVYVPISDQLRFGKVQSASDCNTFCVVKECTETGTILNDTLISVLPAKGFDAANEFAYTVGGVITYMRSPGDALVGYQVGAYKSVSLGYQCTSGTAFASVPGLSSIRLYNGDFFLVADSDCGDGPYTNQAHIYWNGNVVKRYAGSGPTITNVKVFDLDNSVTIPSGVAGTDYSDLAWVVTTGSTNANVPTIGGAPCPDESGPQFVKFSARARVGTAVSEITGIVCNEDGSITANYATMRVLVPI